MARTPVKIQRAKGALANVECILDLVDEARSLKGNREASSIKLHHAGNYQRWCRAIVDGGLPLPDRILRQRAHFRAVGWI